MALTKKILCIEDDAFFLDLLSTLLQSNPNTLVYSAHNGIDGVLIAKSEMPDLILLDLMLPDIHGSEVLVRLKGESGKVEVPVIIFSNLAERDEIEKCLALGAHSYYIKSNTLPSEMVEIVAKELGLAHTLPQ